MLCRHVSHHINIHWLNQFSVTNCRSYAVDTVCRTDVPTWTLSVASLGLWMCYRQLTFETICIIDLCELVFVVILVWHFGPQKIACRGLVIDLSNIYYNRAQEPDDTTHRCFVQPFELIHIYSVMMHVTHLLPSYWSPHIKTTCKSMFCCEPWRGLPNTLQFVLQDKDHDPICLKWGRDLFFFFFLILCSLSKPIQATMEFRF